MATLEETLVGIVDADEALRASFGSRVYPMSLPRSLSLKKGSADLPAMTYAMVSKPKHAEVPVSHPRYRFTVFADKYSTAKRLVEELENCFDGLKVGAIRLSAVIASQDMNDPETGLYMIPVDIKITHMKEV